jgi:hypothetical protein
MLASQERIVPQVKEYLTLISIRVLNVRDLSKCMYSRFTVSTYSENQLFDVRRKPGDETLLTQCNPMICKNTVFKVAAMWSLTTMVGLISSLLKLEKHSCRDLILL